MREGVKSGARIGETSAIRRARSSASGRHGEERLLRQTIAVEARVKPVGTAEPLRAESDGIGMGGVDRVVRGAVLQRGLRVIRHVFRGAAGSDLEHLVPGGRGIINNGPVVVAND